MITGFQDAERGPGAKEWMASRSRKSKQMHSPRKPPEKSTGLRPLDYGLEPTETHFRLLTSRNVRE